MKRVLSYLLISSIAYACSAVEVTEPETIEFEKLISFEAPTSSRYAQGMDIYKGRVFQAYSDGTIDVFELSSGALLQTIGPLKNEKGEILHMNDISFRSEAGKDHLIVPNNGINNPLSYYPILENNEIYELGEQLFIPVPLMDETNYRAATQFFGSNNKCIQVAYKKIDDGNGFGDIVVQAFSFDSLAQTIHYHSDWVFEHERLWAMQGAVLTGDYCYLAVGVGSGEARIYRIDINNGSITCFVDFRKDEDLLPNEEMQGVAFYDGKFYFSTTYGLYKLIKV